MALRPLPRPAFGDDDGTADPVLGQALAAWSRDPAAEPRLLAVLARARLLVPVVALPGGTEPGDGGPRREKSSEMAVLTLVLPSGRRALPVFTSTEALARWRPEARPVAVTAAQALGAALHEQAGALVLDLAGPVTYEASGAALRALASGGSPLRAPAVGAALRGVLAGEPAVLAAHLAPGGPADGVLALSLDPAAAVPRVVSRLARALAADEVLRAHLVRGLDLAVLPPGGTLAGDPVYRRTGLSGVC